MRAGFCQCQPPLKLTFSLFSYLLSTISIGRYSQSNCPSHCNSLDCPHQTESSSCSSSQPSIFSQTTQFELNLPGLISFMVDTAQTDKDIPLSVTSLTSLTQLIESQGGANQVLTQRDILVTLSGSLPGFPLVTKPRSVPFLLCTSWLDSLSQKMTLRPSSKVFVPKILWLAWHWHCWETGETSQSTNSKCDTSTTKHNRSAIWLLIICELGECPFVIGIGDHCQILTDIWWYHLSFLCKTVTFLFYTVACLFCGPSTNSLEGSCDNHPPSSEYLFPKRGGLSILWNMTTLTQGLFSGPACLGAAVTV